MLMGAFSAPIALQMFGGVRPAVATPDGASAFVKNLVDAAILVLKIPVEEQARRERGLRDLLIENFDLPLITRLVVGRYWRKANAAQKEAFMMVFEQHIVQVYTSQLGVYSDQRVEMRTVAARTDKDTIVGTEIMRQSDPPLRLDWLVRETNGSYKIIDHPPRRVCPSPLSSPWQRPEQVPMTTVAVSSDKTFCPYRTRYSVRGCFRAGKLGFSLILGR